MLAQCIMDYPDTTIMVVTMAIMLFEVLILVSNY